MEIKELVSKLKKKSKLQKFSIYQEIIQLCYRTRDQAIFKFYDQLLDHLSDYLQYDNIANPEVKEAIAISSKYVSGFIRHTSDHTRFKKYLPLFEKYKFLIEDASELAHIYQNTGYLFWQENEKDLCIKFLKLSLEQINQTNLLQIPNRYTNLGYIYEQTGDYKKAEEYYQQGLKFAQSNNYQQAMFMAYNAMGRMSLNRAHYQSAKYYFLAALDIHDSNQPDNDYYDTLNNLSTAYVSLKDYKKAINCLIDLQQERLKIENPEIYYSSFINLTICYRKAGQISQAEAAIEKVYDFAQKTKNMELLFGYHYNLAQIELEKKKYQIAIEKSLIAHEISNKTGSIKQQILAANFLAAVYMKLEDYKKALELLAQIEVLTKNQRDDHKYKTYLRNIAECYYKLKDFKNAYDRLDQYCQIEQKIKDADNEKKFKNQSSYPQDTRSGQLLFKNGFTIISRELTEKIGVPLIGQTPAFKQVIHKALIIAENINASVLIKGESGTGKELIAKCIHYASSRKNAPFVPVNSASFADGLVQSSLFGHEKGAFTSAVNRHKGFFEQSDSGTIFLDEISEMPFEIQAQLLRVLEDKKIRRLGSQDSIDLDFRLICATNKDIDYMVEKNLFRLDLLNRINTLEISIPPLRERMDDLPLFIDFYLQKISNRLQRKKVVMEAAVMRSLLSYDFPGNVRELVNIIEKLIIFCKNDFISEEDLVFLNLTKSITLAENDLLSLDLKANEINFIKLAMKRTNNVQVQAAKLLGISPFALNRKLKNMAKIDFVPKSS